jgi:hypothetical protein
MDSLSGTFDVNLLNNTFYNSVISVANPPSTGTLNVSNNIVYAPSGLSPLTDPGNDIDNHGRNIYYRASGTELVNNGTSYTSGTLTTYEASGLSSNPLFVNAANLPTAFSGTYGSTMAPNNNGLALSGSSPALDSGGTLSSSYAMSINSVTRSGSWDRGAYELSVGDTTAPVFSGLTVSGITTSGATVSATVNESATVQINYGLTSSYGSTNFYPGLTTSPSFSLINLAAGTTYHYQFAGADATGNATNTTDNTFDTTAADTAPPAISGTNISSIVADRATTSATTSESAYGGIKWGTTTSVLDGGATNVTLKTSHSHLITGLAPSTLTYVKWYFTDSSGNSTNTGAASFTSAATTTNFVAQPPKNVRIVPVN